MASQLNEEMIVHYCAPTLAGIKTGNLFSCSTQRRGETKKEIRKLNMRLEPKGIKVIMLNCERKRALIYVYRQSQLEDTLIKCSVREILEKRGYKIEKCEKCISLLRRRLKSSEFPHEIGLFLGYPPEDVKAFIEKGGADSKMVGCWKVYENIDEAEKTFESFKQCTKNYERRWAQGERIETLATKN